ncbi:hypothetical protein [Cellulomonas sp. URHD0024]|uniref:hypothetical protein n=1 Tax=Cellulomonas sp. URHD0024 TaxID=1302620 RepID=UPI0004863E7C|nr:hypothetical protein [Cellulomonas sp. URHD0024]
MSSYSFHRSIFALTLRNNLMILARGVLTGPSTVARHVTHNATSTFGRSAHAERPRRGTNIFG